MPVESPFGADLFDLRGKRALVTGGTRGVGRTAAETFLAHGAEVVITSREAGQAEAAAAELGRRGQVVTGLAADLSTVEGVTAFAETVTERFSELHVLVNNAGATWGAPIETYPAAAWAKVLHLDTAVPFMLVQQLLPLLEQAATLADPARVVNIGSIDGSSAGPFENFAYGVAKAGLVHLTHVLARELGPRHITVNCIAPGPIRTRMTERLLDQSAATLVANNPLGRVGELEDMAGPLLLLASRAGSYITGTVLPVDGGYAINRWCEIPPEGKQE